MTDIYRTEPGVWSVEVDGWVAGKIVAEHTTDPFTGRRGRITGYQVALDHRLGDAGVDNSRWFSAARGTREALKAAKDHCREELDGWAVTD